MLLFLFHQSTRALEHVMVAHTIIERMSALVKLLSVIFLNLFKFYDLSARRAHINRRFTIYIDKHTNRCTYNNKDKPDR